MSCCQPWSAVGPVALPSWHLAPAPHVQPLGPDMLLPHRHLSPQTWRGVTKSGNLFVVHVRVPQPGGAPPLRTRLGAWPTREAAARVHDAAQIAILGPKVRPPTLASWPNVLPHACQACQRAVRCTCSRPNASTPAQAAQPALNFPLAHYRGSRQLFGPELAALLQRLRFAAGWVQSSCSALWRTARAAASRLRLRMPNRSDLPCHPPLAPAPACSDEGDPRRRRGGKPKRRRGAPKGRWTATEERREALRAQVAKMHVRPVGQGCEGVDECPVQLLACRLPVSSASRRTPTPACLYHLLCASSPSTTARLPCPAPPPLPQAAKQAKAAQGLPRAKEAVQQARRADPLWVSANARGARAAVTCGVCPACRQVSLRRLPLRLRRPRLTACHQLPGPAGSSVRVAGCTLHLWASIAAFVPPLRSRSPGAPTWAPASAWRWPRRRGTTRAPSWACWLQTRRTAQARRRATSCSGCNALAHPLQHAPPPNLAVVRAA